MKIIWGIIMCIEYDYLRTCVRHREAAERVNRPFRRYFNIFGQIYTQTDRQTDRTTQVIA